MRRRATPFDCLEPSSSKKSVVTHWTRHGLNLIEQVNQTFTALVSVRAVEYLFDHHPGACPFRVNLGTAPGSDIESLDRSVVAEVFAATSPSSNQKKKKDIAKAAAVPAKHRYVFFHCPGNHNRETVGEVTVVPLPL